MATSFVSGSLAAQAQSSLLQSRQQRVLHDVQSGQAARDDSKIDKGAREFESMLLSSWLQQAEQSMATVPGADGDEDSSGRDQMMSLGVQSLASSLTASGGIGIAKMIAKAMHAAEDKAEQKPGPGEPAENRKIGK